MDAGNRGKMQEIDLELNLRTITNFNNAYQHSSEPVCCYRMQSGERDHLVADR